jgi:hypothetical protein
MRIRRKFLQLTRTTIPHGKERLLLGHLPEGYKKDKWGNYFITVGENPTTMFTCHLDTASKEFVNIKHKQSPNFIETDGKSILGADDKAGMTVILWMISKRVPGIYYFFIGEEVGCIGSRALAKEFNFPNIKKVVSFDRRGTSSVITEQLYGRCCSDIFAKALSDQLNAVEPKFKYAPDPTGIMTDSAQFIDLVPECTNISVGYYNEHTGREKQDMEHLIRLCHAVTKVNWESLPVIRDFSKPDLKSDIITDEEIDKFDLSIDFDDFDFSEFNFKYDFANGIRKKIYLSTGRIEFEKELILDLLKSQGTKPSEIFWDGNSCYITEDDFEFTHVGSREEIAAFIEELEWIPPAHKKTSLDFDDEFWNNL